MKITAISLQAHDNNRVNVSVDGCYEFSLNLSQLVDLGLKVGGEFNERDLNSFKQESEFGKLYGRTLEYCLIRPRSKKEIRDYLFRKTRPSKLKNGNIKPGVSSVLCDRVFDRLVERKYIDDYKFAEYWVRYRLNTKGISARKMTAELRTKGIENGIIEQVLGDSDRDDITEVKKVLRKKANRYPDEQKLITYLARQGFRFDDIKRALADNQDENC